MKMPMIASADSSVILPSKLAAVSHDVAGPRRWVRAWTQDDLQIRLIEQRAAFLPAWGN
jgi:hypothetical protein